MNISIFLLMFCILLTIFNAIIEWNNHEKKIRYKNRIFYFFSKHYLFIQIIIIIILSVVVFYQNEYDREEQRNQILVGFQKAISSISDNRNSDLPIWVDPNSQDFKDLRREIDYLKQKQSLNEPLSAKEYQKRGIYNLRIGNDKLAESYFNKAISKDPTFAAPYYNMGSIFYDRNELAKSRGFRVKSLNLAIIQTPL